MVVALGVWVMIVPNLGIPGEWRTIILFVTGFLLIVLGLFMRARTLSRVRDEAQHTFVEHTPLAEPMPDHARKERIHSLN